MVRDERIEARQCSVDGCNEKRRANGFCANHNARWSKRKTFEPAQILEPILTRDAAMRKLLFKREIDNTTGCWLYTGTLNHKGYGVVGIAGGIKSAHRLSAYVFLGFDLNSKKMVCHNCPLGDNPTCFNPDHLWIGTNAQNMKDAREKGGFNGEHSRGSRNNKAKLNDESVKKIKEMLSDGISQNKISKMYSVSRCCICAIDNGKTWKHIKD